jgi:O-antigen ligase
VHELLFFLLLVLLPTQLGYHFWPGWALVLGRRVDYLSPTLYLTDILIFLLLVSWFIIKRKLIFSHRKIQRPFFFKFICFILFIFLNIFFAANRMVALFAWVKILELVALGIYIIRTKPKFSQIIFPLSVGVFYSSVIAIAQFFLQRSIGGPLWFLGERTFSAMTPGIAQIPSPLMLRAYGTFPHPNVLGGFLAVTIPLILFQLINKKKTIYFAPIVPGIIALVLTFSRSAWVVAVLGSMYVIFRNKKRILFSIIFCAILIVFFIVKTMNVQDESVVVREQLNTAAILMFRASPVIGNGLGNFLVRLPDYLVSRTIYFLQPAHNIYLLLLSETGIVGFSIFLWVIWKSGKNIFRKFSLSHLSLFTILLLGLVDHYFLTLQHGQLLFAVFLSLSLIQ